MSTSASSSCESEYESIGSLSCSDMTLVPTNSDWPKKSKNGIDTTSNRPNLGQQRPRRLLWRSWSDTWAWEFASITLSIVHFCILVGTLARWDGRAVSDYDLRLTINTYALVLSLSSRALMIMPVAMAAAQLKWYHSKHGTTLLDFHNLEQASRGPLGAFVSLKTARKPLSILGPLIVLLSLGFEAFTQQSVHVVLPNSVMVLTELSIFEHSGLTHEETVGNITDILGRVLSSIVPANSASYLVPDHSTGCGVSHRLEAPEFTESSFGPDTFASTKPYFTLELCAECWDISDLLQEDCSANLYLYEERCPRRLPSELFAVAWYLITSNSSTRSLYGYESPFMETITWIETISVIEPNQDLRDYFKGPHPVMYHLQRRPVPSEFALPSISLKDTHPDTMGSTRVRYNSYKAHGGRMKVMAFPSEVPIRLIRSMSTQAPADIVLPMVIYSTRLRCKRKRWNHCGIWPHCYSVGRPGI